MSKIMYNTNQVLTKWSSHYDRFKIVKFLSRNCHSSIISKEQYVPKEDFSYSEITFKYSDLQIKLAPQSIRQRKLSFRSFQFGKVFTDHLFKVSYNKDQGGWQNPHIVPFEDIILHPASKVFHYAVQLFEGLKAYRGSDNKIRLFRPFLNMRRMNLSAIRSGLPTFDESELLKCIEEIVKIDSKWIPFDSELCSLYIRPTFIGTDAALGVSTCKSALLYIIMGPVGLYFEKENGISLLADPRFTRAWPGGCGDRKMGSNYAPTIYAQQLASARHHDQLLWLFGDDHQITEVGTMNIFILLTNEIGEKELVTPPLNGLILPGITRQSILEMAPEFCNFKISQRAITMKEIVTAIKKNLLLEMFGVGTACVVSPITSIEYLDKTYHLRTLEHQDPLHEKFRTKLISIYYGKQEHPWATIIA